MQRKLAAEKENATLFSRLNKLELQSRKENIIILNFEETDTSPGDLQFFDQQMTVHMPAYRVDGVMRIGQRRKTSARPIHVIFRDSQDKWNVLSATRLLKGLNIGI